jgi:hypothetical protein
VDIAAIQRSGAERLPLSLNVFPDTCLGAEFADITYDRVGRLTWTGHLQGDDDAGVEGLITLVAWEGVVIGSIDVPGADFYQLRYAGNGVHVVIHVDSSRYPPD